MDIGLIGLAVMGENLALNMWEHGFRVAVYNRTTTKVDDFLEGLAKGTHIQGYKTLPEFVSCLKKPRRLFLMVKAGQAVDDLIDSLLPLLDKGDILIDGGNSYYMDTTRRCRALKEKGFLYLGTGISGGEEGARHGPSIMPGGDRNAWDGMKEILQAIAAKVEGMSCAEYVGEEGSGHFVKMVHNGIEYGDMALIAETYHLLSKLGGLDADALHTAFSTWNTGDLESYLIEITAEIFKKRDDDGSLLLDKILDVAGQKGTGKWTAIEALNVGVPLTLISESVFSRYLSSLKEERKQAAPLFPLPPFEKQSFLQDMEKALYAAKILSYTQGFMLLKAASDEYSWKIDYGKVALLWRGGCIIRSRFLSKINEAFTHNPQLESLLLDPFFSSILKKSEESLRRVVIGAVKVGIPVPCFSAALSFFDGYRSEKLPANLIQAQRDYFGAHTYERVDRPRGEFFHTDWQNT